MVVSVDLKSVHMWPANMEQLVNIEQLGGVEEGGEEEVLAATPARGDAEGVAILAGGGGSGRFDCPCIVR
jgi:hypothetical protein